MQKKTTSLNKTDFPSGKKYALKPQEFEPQKTTLLEILTFSRIYRVEQITNNQYIDLFLN